MLRLVRVRDPPVSTERSEYPLERAEATVMENSFTVVSFWTENVVPLFANLDWTVKVTEACVDPES